MSQENDPRESTPAAKHEYTSADLVHLTDREHVRKRPGMYIGSTGHRGRHQLLEEVFTLMLDCFSAGSVTQISVVIHQDESITVRDDNTRCSLEVDEHFSADQGREVTNFEREMASLRNTGGAAFFGAAGQKSGSMFGITIACVNFLSQWLQVEACSESELYRQTYREGELEGPLETSPRVSESGTTITFLPDPSIFQSDGTRFDYETIRDRVEILAYLNAGLTTQLKDERTGDEVRFEFPQGAREWLHKIPAAHRNSLCGSPPVLIEASEDGVEIEIAIQPVRQITSYVNGIPCSDGGTHLSSFFDVMTDVLNEIEQCRSNYSDSNPLPTAADYESEMMGMVALRMESPQWGGATRSQILDPSLAEFAETCIRPKLVEYFDAHPDLAEKLFDDAKCAAKARVVQ